jgi:hypothetical protein
MGEDQGGDKIRLRRDLPSEMPLYSTTQRMMKDTHDSITTII